MSSRRDYPEVYIEPESRDNYQRQRPIVLDYQPQSTRDYMPANGLPPVRRHSAQDYLPGVDTPPASGRRPASDFLPAGRRTKDDVYDSDYPPAGKSRAVQDYPLVYPERKPAQTEVIEMQPVSYTRRAEPPGHMTNRAMYTQEQPGQYGRRGYGWTTCLFECASDIGVCK